MFFSKLFCTIFLISGLPVDANLVSIKQGLLKGTTMISRNGTTFNAFLGIPYAEPPIGNLRFKSPVPAKPWTGIFNASETPPMCIQVIENTTETQGIEDCLNLNVYSPLDAKPGDNIPVLVYIFGGIFKRGSNVDNGPQYMMNKRVIIVMPNYRLGVLGFLSTGDTVIPGNFGLKDQTLALRWTKENIYAFGGNPDLITLHGHSSGAMCVHLHMFSPLSKGLFNRVIIQSGPALQTGSFFDKHVSRDMAVDLAHRVGCLRNSSDEMLECFLTLEADVFPLVQNEIILWKYQVETATFRPAVEDKNVKNAFITKLPIKSPYQSTDLQMLIGITTGECAFVASEFLCNGGKPAKELDSYYKTLFPIIMQYFWTAEPKAQTFISNVARAHYFGNKHIDDETATQLMDMNTDMAFVRSTLDCILKYEGVKYVYLYDYWSNYSTQNKIGPYRRLGISHAEELHLIFYHSSSASSLTDRDIVFGDELITRLLNFIYSGNPNEPFAINENMYSPWGPVKSEHTEYLHLKLNGTMKTNFGGAAYRFWKHLPIWNKFY